MMTKMKGYYMMYAVMVLGWWLTLNLWSKSLLMYLFPVFLSRGRWRWPRCSCLKSRVTLSFTDTTISFASASKILQRGNMAASSTLFPIWVYNNPNSALSVLSFIISFFEFFEPEKSAYNDLKLCQPLLGVKTPSAKTRVWSALTRRSISGSWRGTTTGWRSLCSPSSTERSPSSISLCCRSTPTGQCQGTPHEEKLHHP